MLLLLFSIAFCIWNQIHLICISISTKISSDLLIYFAKNWIQYICEYPGTYWACIDKRVCFWCIWPFIPSAAAASATVATKTKCVFKMSDLFCSGYLLLSWILWYSHFCSTCSLLFASIRFILFIFFRVCLYFTSAYAIACLSFSLAYTWSVIVAENVEEEKKRRREKGLICSSMLHDSCLFFEISIQFHLYSDSPNIPFPHWILCALCDVLDSILGYFFLFLFRQRYLSLDLYIQSQPKNKSQTLESSSNSRIPDARLLFHSYSIFSAITC